MRAPAPRCPAGRGRRGFVLGFVRQQVQDVPDGIEPSDPLVVVVHEPPRGFRRVGAAEQLQRRERVVLPERRRSLVERAELPLLERVLVSRLEPSGLFVASDREPDLDEMDAVVDEELLERHDLFEEPGHLLVGREVHDAFDAGAVVPGPVEERDLAARRELLDVALEVPLAALPLAGSGQGHVAGEARVHVLAHALDRAALAGGVAPLEQQQHPLTVGACPLLHLHELDLEREQVGPRTRAA